MKTQLKSMIFVTSMLVSLPSIASEIKVLTLSEFVEQVKQKEALKLKEQPEPNLTTTVTTREAEPAPQTVQPEPLALNTQTLPELQSEVVEPVVTAESKTETTQP